jgi:DNA processing protein
LIPFFDNRYPDRLKTISGPLLLYGRGNLSLIHKKDSIGFTGTREASAQALEWTKETAKELAKAGRVVISGGATGVDTAAHHGALDAGGDTIVVLGTGIDVPYPETNESLFERVVKENGLILSQRPLGSGPTRSGFLSRNETLTGLSHTVTVVATDGSGGTMSTYEDSVDQGRLVVCPDPELQLNPTEGIEGILDKNGAETVRNAKEILSAQRISMEEPPTDEIRSKQEETNQVDLEEYN